MTDGAPSYGTVQIDPADVYDVCLTCGAVVYDTDQHTEWHILLEARRA